MAAIATSAGRRGAGLLAAFLVAGLAPACGGSRSTDAPASPPPPPSTSPSRPTAPTAVIPSTPTRLQAAFAPLRSPPEGLPRSVTRLMTRPIDGTNWRLSQKLPTGAGPAVWAVPGRTVLCLVGRKDARSEVTASCTSADRAVRHGVAMTSLAPTPGASSVNRVVIGLVPDRTRAVRVTTSGFASRTALVTGNTFMLRDAATEPPEAITLLP